MSGSIKWDWINLNCKGQFSGIHLFTLLQKVIDSSPMSVYYVRGQNQQLVISAVRWNLGSCHLRTKSGYHSPLFPFLNKLACKHEGGIDLLVKLSTTKGLSLLPKTWNCSSNSKQQGDKIYAMVSVGTKVRIFDAKHIKYLQSKPEKTIHSIYKLDMSDIRILQSS